MKAEEITIIKVTAPPVAKRRTNGYWNLDADHHTRLREAVEKCLETGEEQIVQSRGELMCYVVRPHYPLIESAMQKSRNKDFLKVSIAVFGAMFHCGVKP